jgi:hypothetical protein
VDVCDLIWIASYAYQLPESYITNGVKVPAYYVTHSGSGSSGISTFYVYTTGTINSPTRNGGTATLVQSKASGYRYNYYQWSESSIEVQLEYIGFHEIDPGNTNPNYGLAISPKIYTGMGVFNNPKDF